MQDGLEEAEVGGMGFGDEGTSVKQGRRWDRKGEACLGDRRKISLRLVVCCLDVRTGYEEAGTDSPRPPPEAPRKLGLLSAHRTK